jgi:hypothetical protein
METVYKLQPHRTMQLRGFDGYGCTAALWGASDAGFTVSGVWGEQSDFAVLELWNADSQYEHPRARYLPDFDFTGMTLSFDLETSNCMPLDSSLWPSVDWPYLNVLYADGTSQQIPLIAHATAATGAYAGASATFTLGGTVTGLDYVELVWEAGDGVTPSSRHSTQMMYYDTTPAQAAANLAAGVNAGTATTGMSALASGSAVTLTYKAAAGANGNRVGAYGNVNGAATETWTPVSQLLTGGTSPSKWSFSFAFSSAPFTSSQIAQIWITFAPAMQTGDFARTEFSAVVTNWSVADPNGVRALKVAGYGSARIEEASAWVVRTGYWEPADAVGFWSGGRAIRSAYSATETRSLTIETHCGAAHNIYLGTRLDANCGIVSAALDGGAPVTVDCYGAGLPVRRKLFAGAAAGKHSVTLTLASTKNAASGGWYFYFDFLECAVASAVPDPPETRTDVAVATDFDTDATYKMSPQRLLWGIQKTGLVGEIDHYAGVFWWPERAMTTPASAWQQQTTATFAGTPTFGTVTSLFLGSSEIDHLNFIADTPASIAEALALEINASSTAVWASAAGAVLTIYGRAGSADYHMAITAATHDANFTAAVSTVNAPAAAVAFGVDPGATLNRAARDWHADWFAALQGAGIGVVASFSQELVNPPDNPPGAVWIQRFPDGAPVQTATGFGTLYSSQIAFGAAVRTYMANAYAAMGALMAAAGLPPRLQLGEVGWWFQANAAGMAFYDADTAAAALAPAPAGLHRALAAFLTPHDDPAINAYADANFLRARLKGYADWVRASALTACPDAIFELLWPMDVNDPDACRLMRYINLPAEWQARAGSGFDTFLVEGFQYAGVDFNIDKAKRCAAYPFAELGWDRAHCRYNMGWYTYAWPWRREFAAAGSAGAPIVKMWAYDHLCLFGWPLPMPREGAAALL